MTTSVPSYCGSLRLRLKIAKVRSPEGQTTLKLLTQAQEWYIQRAVPCHGPPWPPGSSKSFWSHLEKPRSNTFDPTAIAGFQCVFSFNYLWLAKYFISSFLKVSFKQQISCCCYNFEDYINYIIQNNKNPQSVTLHYVKNWALTGCIFRGQHTIFVEACLYYIQFWQPRDSKQ